MPRRNNLKPRRRITSFTQLKRVERMIQRGEAPEILASTAGIPLKEAIALIREARNKRERRMSRSVLTDGR
jgi:hypothetical protein